MQNIKKKKILSDMRTIPDNSNGGGGGGGGGGREKVELLLEGGSYQFFY